MCNRFVHYSIELSQSDVLFVFVDNKHVVIISSGIDMLWKNILRYVLQNKNVGYTIMSINLVSDSCASTLEVSSKLRLLVSGLQ